MSEATPHAAEPAADPAACPIPTPSEGLSGLERAELALIGLTLVVLPLATQGLEWSPRFGALLAYAAALILGQGLLRDLARLALEGRKEATQKLMCLCAESTIGVAALAAGTLLLAIGIKDTVTLGPLSLTLLVGAILGLGYVAKNYVLVLKKVKDHGTIAVG